MQTLIAFLGALTLLIFVHEMGHYLAARYFDVKVLRFSIGFGKPLITRRIGPDQTEWSIGLIPLGGYVRMVDERDESQSDISARDLPRAFTRQSLGARSVIVAAGPIANFLLAILLYATLGLIGVNEPAAVVAQPPANSPAATAGLREGDQIQAIDGSDIRSWHEVRMKLLEPVIERRADVRLDVERAGQPTELTLSTTALPEGEAERDFMGALGMAIAPGDVLIGGVLEDSASSRAGLREGDRIVRINDVPVVRARDVINVVKASAEQSIMIDIERGGSLMSLPIVPESVSDETAESGRSGRIGAQLRDAVRMELVRHGPLDSLMIGARQTLDMSLFSLRMFGKMIMGELSLRNLSGPVTIADLAGQTAKVGWYAYLSFLALISISLGVLNLLPIPVLDGGHLVYYALEAIRGRPLSDRVMEFTQRAGVGIIMMLMVVALFNDITRLIGS